MRASVPAALDEGEVRMLVVVHPFCGEALDRLRQQFRVVGNLHPLRLLTYVDDRILVFDLSPLEGRLVAVHVEAFDILSRGLEQRAGYFESQLLPAYLE